MPYPKQEKEWAITPIVHIEVELSGSARMTFKGEFADMAGAPLLFKHPRDADAHARYMGYETITRKENPEYFQ